MVRVSGKAVAAIPAGWIPGVLILLLLCHPHSACALDASLLAGATDSADTDESTYAWQIDFRHDFESPFGAGAYRYFDTKRRTDGSHGNSHGTAPMYSLSASCFTETRWFFRLAANHIYPASEINTNSFLLGVGYRLGREPAEKTHGGQSGGESPPQNTGTELTPFLGVTVRNSLDSRGGLAGGIEYRRGFSRNFDWTLSWINDDNQEEIRRSGIGTQIWLVDPYLRPSSGIMTSGGPA